MEEVWKLDTHEQFLGFKHVQSYSNASRGIYTDAQLGKLLVVHGQVPQNCSVGLVIQQSLLKSFRMPDFTKKTRPIQSASTARFLRQCLSTEIELSPYCIGEAVKEEIRSLCGLPITPMQTSSRLHSTKDRIPGIHTPYVYVSSGSSFGCLHKEDFNLLSANILHAGSAKIWIIIPAREGQTLESLISEDLGLEYKCDQLLRHPNLFIPPSKLNDWNIRHHLVVQTAGDLIVTDYGAYHQVFNTGPNIAEAINGCEDNWVAPISYLECSRSCTGLDPIMRASFSFVSPTGGDGNASRNASSKKRSRRDRSFPKPKPPRPESPEPNPPEPNPPPPPEEPSSPNPLPNLTLQQRPTLSILTTKMQGADLVIDLEGYQQSVNSLFDEVNRPVKKQCIAKTSLLELSLSSLSDLVEQAIALKSVWNARDELMRFLPGKGSGSWLTGDIIMTILKILNTNTEQSSFFIVEDFLVTKSLNGDTDGLKSGIEAKRSHDQEDILFPRCQDNHWDLIHLNTKEPCLTFYGSIDRIWAAKLVGTYQLTDCVIKEQQPLVIQQNSEDCGLVLLAQADVLINEEHKQSISQDPIALRTRYLSILVEYARSRLICEDPSQVLPNLAVDSRINYIGYFIPPQWVDLKSAFASPQVFGELCNIRRGCKGHSNSNPILRALELSNTSKTQRTQSYWYDTVASRYIFLLFRKLEQEKKDEIYRARKERRCSINTRKNCPTQRAKTLARDSLVEICQQYSGLRIDHLKTWLIRQIRKGKQLEKLVQLAGYGLYEPFWMLVPVEYFHDITKMTSEEYRIFQEYIKSERPILMSNYQIICQGLRIILGLDKGELVIDSLTPLQLSEEQIDSELILRSLQIVNTSPMSAN